MTRQSGTRAALYQFLAAHPPADLTQISDALGWGRMTTRRAIQHALEVDVVAVHSTKARGHRYYTIGSVKPRFQPAAPAPARRRTSPFHIAPQQTRFKREGSGQMAGLTWRAQLCRQALAELERGK